MTIGCGNAETYTYEKKEAKEQFEELYLTKAEFDNDSIKVYWNGDLDSLDGYDFYNDSIVADGHTITIHTSEPGEFKELFFKNDYRTYRFRNLDSDMYAAIRVDMDSEGGLHIEGDEDKFYTDEEKENMANAKKARIVEQARFFSLFEGTWIADDGSYYRFYKDNTYCLEDFWVSNEYPEGENYIHNAIQFSQGRNASEYEISFDYGAMMHNYYVELSEDGNTLNAGGKVLRKGSSDTYNLQDYGSDNGIFKNMPYDSNETPIELTPVE